MDQQDEDDLVLRLPIFNSLCESGGLYMLVYPTYTAQSRDLDGHIIEARLRPSCKELELVQRIEADSLYDWSKGEQLALNVDGAHRDHRDSADNYFPSGYVDRMVLRSGAPIQTDRYCVVDADPEHGVTVTPLSAYLTLKPALDYIDKADARVKEEKKAEEDAEEGINTEDVAKAVTVRFERAENDRIKNARKNSYGHQQRIIQDEPWIKLQYTGLGHKFGEQMRQMAFHTVDDYRIEFNMPPSQFYSLLVNPSSITDTQHTIKPASANEPLPLDVPLTTMHTYPLQKQIEIIMRRVGVIRYSEILWSLAPDVRQRDSSIMEKVQACATLVQGCWVLKSYLLYPSDPAAFENIKKSNSKANRRALRKCHTEAATAHTAMQRVRDLALYLLTTEGYVDRLRLSDDTPVDGDDLLTMLRGIAKPDLSSGVNIGRWMFLRPHDIEFTQKYKDVIQRYCMLWELFGKQVSS